MKFRKKKLLWRRLQEWNCVVEKKKKKKKKVVYVCEYIYLKSR